MELRPPAQLVSTRARTLWAVQGVVLTVILLAVGIVALVLADPSGVWIALGIIVIAVVFVVDAVVMRGCAIGSTAGRSPTTPSTPNAG